MLLIKDQADAELADIITKTTIEVAAERHLLLTAAEVARVLRCGVRTVRRLVRAGVLPAVRNPGRNSHLRIPAASVRRYIQLNTPDADDGADTYATDLAS